MFDFSFDPQRSWLRAHVPIKGPENFVCRTSSAVAASNVKAETLSIRTITGIVILYASIKPGLIILAVLQIKAPKQ
jgi:hypothetical protein